MSFMKRNIQYATTLKTKAKAYAEWNYNESMVDMYNMGETLNYKAPEDPVAHPQYVDAEGRILPVSPTTLQIMSNSTGHVLDKAGRYVPVYERGRRKGDRVHKDDVRVAVASRDVTAVDEKGEDILLSPDGTIIPTGDDGVVATVIRNGKPWAVDAFGNPVAPLEMIVPLHSYRKPVSAYNYPVTYSYVPVGAPKEPFSNYFPISSIAEGNRPRERGALVAWADNDKNGTLVSKSPDKYKRGRFYTASEDRVYKYWTAPEESSSTGISTGSPIQSDFAVWTPIGATDIVTGDNMIQGRFSSRSAKFENIVSLGRGRGVNMSFTAITTIGSTIRVYVDEWNSFPDLGLEGGSHHGYGRYHGRKLIYSSTTTASTPKTHRMNFMTADNSEKQKLIIEVSTGLFSQPPGIPIPGPGLPGPGVPGVNLNRATLSELAIRNVYHPIAGAGPRVEYQTPVKTNKIVVGVDITLDERKSGEDSQTNRPYTHGVHIQTDRGDGVFEWNRIVQSPEIDSNGMIELYYHGNGVWSRDIPEGDHSVEIMGIHYTVWNMNRANARLNITEISARYWMDVTDRLISYSTDTEVSEHSNILPFGTVSSNTGSLQLANDDGIFNGDAPFLLNETRYLQNGKFSFSSNENPLYRIANAPAYFIVDTLVYDADGVPGEDYVRALTMKSEDVISSSDMSIDVSLKDGSLYLQGVSPGMKYYTSKDGMSVVQVLYMLLDSVGFTSVRFDEDDEHFSAHMKHFWTTEDQTVWEAIEDICRSTQTVAYFDEHNLLNFRSLRGMYEDALYRPPADTLTTEDIGARPSNIISIGGDATSEINSASVEYVELKEADISRSGVPVMEAVWEPEGTQVLRGGPLVDHINGVQPTVHNGSKSVRLPWNTTRVWPFDGVVQIDAELIRYSGKEYYYYSANGKTQIQKYINSEEERQALDDICPQKAALNAYTGRLKIVERGYDGTQIKSHTARGSERVLTSQYGKRLKLKNKPAVGQYVKNLSVHQSVLQMRNFSTWTYDSWYTVFRGSPDDYAPTHYGTRLRVGPGPKNVDAAGLGIGLYGDSGVWIEVTSTEAIEAPGIGRKRNELTIYTTGVKPGWRRDYASLGAIVPITRGQWYDLDVAVSYGLSWETRYTYAKYEKYVLKEGDSGKTVQRLQEALNKNGEKLAVNGQFDYKVTGAVKRIQAANELTEDGIVGVAEWRALGSYNVLGNGMTVHATIDGIYSATAFIPAKDMPQGAKGGRWGMYSRGHTAADFEYVYALRGPEEVIPDQPGFYDRLKRGYVGDILRSYWVHNTKNRYVIKGGKKVLREVVNNQLFYDDFGAHVHEVRDYDVKFSDGLPALYSYPYISNDREILCTDYLHKPFGAKFRLVNTTRGTAVLKGSDTTTYGADNPVDQVALIYGRRLKETESKSITIEDVDAVKSRGSKKVSVTTNWIQTEEAAKKLGSHLIEAMSQQTRTFELEVFGNPLLRVGQFVTLYAPAEGIGGADISNINRLNRYFVYSVNQNYDGAYTTSASIRRVIPESGFRYKRLSDVLAFNNNNLLANQYLNEVDGNVPADVSKTADARLSVGTMPNGGNVARLRGSAASSSSPDVRSVGLIPNIWGLYDSGLGAGRYALNAGHHYLFTANFYADKDCAVALVLEGFNTTGYSKVVDRKVMQLRKGDHKRVVMNGQFIINNLPEVRPVIYLLKKDGKTGGTTAETVTVKDMFFRTSNDASAIYPMHGYSTLTRP